MEGQKYMSSHLSWRRKQQNGDERWFYLNISKIFDSLHSIYGVFSKSF
jgi:hypothetical protein